MTESAFIGTPPTDAELDRAIDRYNDECRVLALHAMQYASSIGTVDEKFCYDLLMMAIERTRQCVLAKSALFEMEPPIEALR